MGPQTVAKWLALAACGLALGCANGNGATVGDQEGVDPGGPDGGGADATMMQPDDASGGDDSGSTRTDTGPSAAVDSSALDTGGQTAIDSGSAGVDSGSGMPDSASIDSGRPDSAVIDSSIPDVVIPDVVVPMGTTVCNYLGSAGDFALYTLECAFLSGGGKECASGCSASQCCGALCQDNSGEPVCLSQ